MHFFHKLCKKLIARLEIPYIADSLLVLCSMNVVLCPFRNRLTAVSNNFPVMGIDIIVILYIIFVVGR